MRQALLASVALVLTVTTLIAAQGEKRIPTLKIGKCEITLLDSNGIKPLSGATLSLQRADNGKTAVSATASKSGLCEITVAEGRYVLSVNDKPVTLLNASKDGQMAWARIVLSDSPMLVGGQEGTTTATFTFLGLSGKAAVTAAVAAGVITVGAGGTIIYNEVNNDDDGAKDTPPPQQQQEEEEEQYNAPGVSL